MNSSNIYILCLLTAFVSVGVSAQNAKIKTNQFSSADNIKQLEESVKQNENKLNNPKLNKNQRIDCLTSLASDRDKIIDYQKMTLQKLTDDYNSLTGDYGSLKSRLDTLEIHEFLGKQSTDVFTADIPAVKVQLSVCSQTQLSLIQKIRSVNEDLKEISKKISDENIGNFAKNNSVSREDAKKFLSESAENGLLEADKKMTEIDGMNLSLLSPEQQQFYKQTVTGEYRAIYRKIYP